MERELNKINNDENDRHYLFTYLVSFIFLYALFVPARVKLLFSWPVEGILTTNELWILSLVYVLLYIIGGIDKKLLLQSENRPFLVIIYIYILIIISGGFKIVSVSQYVYASLIFLMPMFLFFTMSYASYKDIIFLLKVFIVSSLIYSVFSIVLAISDTFFNKLVENYVEGNYNYSQSRARTMLGSSITVSYYFNITLPLCFYMFYSCKEKRWRIVSVISIFTNIVATFILLSRAAVLCVILILIFNLFFVIKENKFRTNLILIILLLLAITFTTNKYDLSRLALGFDKTEESIASRLRSGKLGLHIFAKYPLLGSGMGRYYKRVYTPNNRYLNIDGMIGLIDPHNMYVLILSEMGLIGFILSIILFLLLFNRFLQIEEKLLSQMACLTLFAFLLDAMGGSHLFNSISFSILFWIYMGVFNNIYLNGKIH